METKNDALIDELNEMRKCFRLLPFNLVLDQLLTETVKSREAYAFIREKRLYSEFLVFRQSAATGGNTLSVP